MTYRVASSRLVLLVNWEYKGWWESLASCKGEAQVGLVVLYKDYYMYSHAMLKVSNSIQLKQVHVYNSYCIDFYRIYCTNALHSFQLTHIVFYSVLFLLCTPTPQLCSILAVFHHPHSYKIH